MMNLAGGSAYKAGECRGDEHKKRAAEPPLRPAGAEAVEQRGAEERGEAGHEENGDDGAWGGAADDVVVGGRCHELVAGGGLALDAQSGAVGSGDDTLTPFAGSDGLCRLGGGERAGVDVAGGKVRLVERGGTGLERRGL